MNTPKPKRRFRWQTVGCLLLVVVLIGGSIAVIIYRNILVRPPDTTAQLQQVVVSVEQDDLIETVQVNGVLEPVDKMTVSFPDGVRVVEVLKAEGEHVVANQILARLETRDLELKITSAKARLDQAQQALRQLQAGPSPVDLAKAAARVARARADLAADANAVRAIDIELAKRTLDLARERLAELQAGSMPAEVLSAEQALIAAQDAQIASRAAQERTRDSASLAKTSAEQAVDRGAQDLIRVQRAYSDAFWDWQYVQSTSRHPREQVTDPETEQLVNRQLAKSEIEQFRRIYEDAQFALSNSELDMKRLVEAAERARADEVRQLQTEDRTIAAAARTLAEAQRSYDRQHTRGAATALLEARLAVADAEKAYRILVDAPARLARRAELDAALLDAIAAEEKLKRGSDPLDLAQAQTTVDEALVAHAAAEADLDAATLRAPIAGTIVDITLKPGMRTNNGDSVVIADLSRFLLRGEVTEQSVATVQVGQSAQVVVDSVPGQEFTGTLTRVSELPTETRSDNGAPIGGLYPIELVIVADDPRIRVGMATTGRIETLVIRDTLIIPVQAVIDDPNGPYVQRVIGEAGADGIPATEHVPVQLGATSNDRVQVLSGLNPEDRVLLPQMPPTE
jgi:RND family efflux transporter MFP subunit